MTKRIRDYLSCSLITTADTHPMIPAGMRRRMAARRKGKPFMRCRVAG